MRACQDESLSALLAGASIEVYCHECSTKIDIDALDDGSGQTTPCDFDIQLLAKQHGLPGSWDWSTVEFCEVQEKVRAHRLRGIARNHGSRTRRMLRMS